LAVDVKEGEGGCLKDEDERRESFWIGLEGDDRRGKRREGLKGLGLMEK